MKEIEYMADVQPLLGIRYNEEASGNLAQLITPPYDVISEQAQAEYYARNPYNIIRLELGMDEPGNTPLNNRSTRAATTDGEGGLISVLQRGQNPCYYVYEQQVRDNAPVYTRASLLARVR